MIKTFENFNNEIDPFKEENWDDDNYFYFGNIVVSNEKIKNGDFIIDIEKINIIIDNAKMGVVKCVDILDDYDLVWESLDGKSSACDSIYQFKKVIKF